MLLLLRTILPFDIAAVQTFTGSRQSMVKLDERLDCDTEFVVVAVVAGSVTTSFCPPLRLSRQTLSLLPLACCCVLAAAVVEVLLVVLVLLFFINTCQDLVKRFIIQHNLDMNQFQEKSSPNNASAHRHARPTVAVFDDAVLMTTRLCAACLVMLFATCIEILAQRTLDGEIAARFGFQVSIVHLHMNDPHKLNLSGELLNLFLPNKHACVNGIEKRLQRK